MEELDNISDIVEAVFDNPPGAQNSVLLQLDSTSTDLAYKRGVETYVFEILCLITFKGMQRLYGHKNLMELTECEFNTIAAYMRSMGYKINVLANDTKKTPWDLLKDNIIPKRYKISFESII